MCWCVRARGALVTYSCSLFIPHTKPRASRKMNSYYCMLQIFMMEKKEEHILKLIEKNKNIETFAAAANVVVNIFTLCV